MGACQGKVGKEALWTLLNSIGKELILSLSQEFYALKSFFLDFHTQTPAGTWDIMGSRHSGLGDRLTG